MMIRSLLFILALFPFALGAQNLPDEVRVTSEGRLTHGATPVEGLYNPENVHRIELLLSEPNWFDILDGPGGGGPGGGGPGGNNGGEPLVGTLIFNDEITFDSVVISIKGQTSDFQNNSEKKSFSIQLDEYVDQDLMGYDNLNLNGAFQDQSSMREVLYYDVSRGFTQALKGAFVDLYINGEYWGPYGNIQQLEGVYIREWFTNNDGSRWRAELQTTGGGGPGGGGGGPGGGGGGPNFGAGVSSLNYNGPDASDYVDNYELKRTDKDNPWEDIIQVAQPLENAPIEDLYEVLNPILDIDRTLWYLAQEAVFSDDDSYIFKGGMDYYVYWDAATDRLMPMEVDGNSVMVNSNVNWSPFYHEDDPDFPLMNRMLQNSEIRQRYLAHLRTILSEHFVVQSMHDRIDEFAATLDQRVQDDPKKIYSYNQFLNGVNNLKTYLTNRHDFLSGNAEIDHVGVSVTEVTRSVESPAVAAPVGVNVTVAGDAQMVRLYYATGLDGAFERTELFDDGQHDDGMANDGVFGGELPGYAAGTYVRYYVEAIADDAQSTATFFPAHAERDVFFYRVQLGQVVNSDVVINEIMADNDNVVTDAAGNFEDWIELYNTGGATVDLTGYFLTDDSEELDKWQFPDGTTIGSDGYLIVWTDDDEDETSAEEIHTNFKLSAGGESLIMVNASGEIVQQIDFDEQTTDVSYARSPNGTGDFVFKGPTFGVNNNTVSSSDDPEALLPTVRVFPNPASNLLTVEVLEYAGTSFDAELFDALGRQVRSVRGEGTQVQMDVAELPSGLFLLRINEQIAVRVTIAR